MFPLQVSFRGRRRAVETWSIDRLRGHTSGIRGGILPYEYTNQTAETPDFPSQKQKALRKERLSHRWTVTPAARTPREITANSTCRIRPGVGSSQTARLRSSSAR